MSILIQNIIEIANVVVEIALIFHYFSLLSEKKNNWSLMILSYFSAAVLLSVSVFLSGNFMVNFLSTAVVLTLISFLNFEDKFTRRIFLIFIYLLIISIAEPIVIGILCIANMGSPEDFLHSGIGRYLGMIGTDLIYLWLTGIMQSFINKKIRSLPVKYWILIIAVPIISIFLLQTILESFIGRNKLNYVSLTISLSGIIYINIMMFNFFESYDDKIKLQYIEKLKQQEQENYSLLALTHKQVKEFKHDIENQFAVLNELLESGNIADAKKHLTGLSTFVHCANRICYTGNNAVDSIVNIKGSLAQTYGIEFICKVNILTVIKADELELCRIIGNGLDNAIEGCQRSEISKKHICFSISEEREKLFIVITNTSDKVNPDYLRSVKNDTAIHGIGVNSIKSSVERLGGLVKFEYSDGIFRLNIMVQNSLII